MKGILILALAMTLQLTMALECFKCSYDLNSNQNTAHYCLTNVEQDAAVQVETCADGVTSCYIQGVSAITDHTTQGESGTTTDLQTTEVSRGCLPDGDTCDDSAHLVNGDRFTYKSCCTDDRCNEGDLAPSPGF